MERRTIEFLSPNEFKTLKIIKIARKSWNSFSGFLAYTRNFNPNDNDFPKNDETDDIIFKSIKDCFGDSEWWLSENIFFKNQLEERLKIIEGGCRFDLNIEFNPLISFNEIHSLIGKPINIYPIKFSVRMLLGKDDARVNTINNYLACSFPHDKLDSIVKTIHPL